MSHPRSLTTPEDNISVMAKREPHISNQIAGQARNDKGTNQIAGQARNDGGTLSDGGHASDGGARQ